MQKRSHNSVIAYILFFIPHILAVMLLSCEAPSAKNTRIEETIEVKTVFNKLRGDTVEPSITVANRVWYQDSFAIEEVRMFDIVESGNVTTQTTHVDHYRFNDLRRQWIYMYKHLSDTATAIRKFTFSDTTELDAGWDYRKEKRIKIDTLRMLTDTTMKGVVYKRAWVSAMVAGFRSRMICFFQCDRKGTMFDFDPVLSAKIGCPLVLAYALSPDGKHVASESELTFVANSVEDSVMKVFKAWIANEKKNPIP